MTKKLFAILLALCMALSLAACGNTSGSEPEEEPAEEVEEETPAEEAEEEEEPENRVYTYTEENGSEWTITLEASGAFTLAELNAISGETTKHSGATWTDNGDGTFSTSAWYDPDSDKAAFFSYDGACTWIDNGDGTATPASDGSTGDGINPGKYTYTEDCGDFTIEWSVLLNGDGTFQLEEVHGLSGETLTYTGNEWTDNGDGTATTGAWNEEGDVSDFMEADGTTIWTINADGTCAPAVAGEASASDGINPGKYIYTEDCGDFTIEWAVCLNGNGTFQLEETHGLSGETLTYTGNEWVDNGDGTATTGAWNEEGDKSDYMEADGTTIWAINADGTCTPAALAEGGEAAAAEGINPGKYLYTEDMGDFTIEWAVCLNGNGTFQLEETHGLSGETLTYTGNEWVDNGDGTATTGAWNEEGDKSDFMAEDGTATWTINADGTCTPVTE